MQVFAFEPKRDKKETLTQFNERVISYCEENYVINIEAQPFNDGFILSCLEAEDVPQAVGQPILIPTVRGLKEGASIESLIMGTIEKIEDSNPEEPDDENGETIPIGVKMIEKASSPGKGWFLLICINGIYMGDDGNDDDDEGGDKTTIPPAPNVAGVYGQDIE